MHISRISLVNFRNFQAANVLLKAGVNTIIGENGSGKTNLFYAVQLLLDDNKLGRRHQLTSSDFHRGLSDWRGHWISILLEFDEISADESIQALFQHHTADDQNGDPLGKATYGMLFRPNRETRDRFAGLPAGGHEALAELQASITVDDYETYLFGRATADLSDPEQYKEIVGDFDNVIFPATGSGVAPDWPELGVRIPRQFSLEKEFSFSYIPALRNVVRDFQYSKSNPLHTLLRAKSEEIAPGSFDDVIGKARDLNTAIESRDDVTEIRDDIQSRFKSTVGETYSPTSMSIKSELPLEAAELFQSLKLYVGEHGERYEGSLEEMSLGGANLVYLTLKLLEFDFRMAREAIANFLIIEEPEAHIHTHVQKTLFNRLEYDKTQIIYSTHSTHISEVSAIERVNVLSREGHSWTALQPAAGLGDKEAERAERFLDAIRSNLLFARGVILVEGDAEEILIPNLIQEVYGVSLDELGISLINVRSTQFQNLANLFHEDRLRKHCAIVTDSDAAFFNTEPQEADNDYKKKRRKKAADSAEAGEARVELLTEYANDNEFVEPFFASHTFEVDFADASRANRELLEKTVDELYSQKAARDRHKKNLQSKHISNYGLEALDLAEKDGKGWFALLLARHLDSSAVVPGYILKSIAFATQQLPHETWARVIRHRLRSWEPGEAASAEVEIKRLLAAEVTLEDVSTALFFIRDDDQLSDFFTAFDV